MRTLPLLITLLLAAATAGQDVRHARGVVVDEDDRPLAGVAVCPFDSCEPFTTAELTARPAARTGVDGSFELAWNEWQRPPLDSVLFVAEGRVHVATGLGYVDMMPIILPRGRTLAGTVRDAAGKPLAGVRVEARDWLTQSGFFGFVARWSVAPEPRTAVRTDASGRFVLAGTCDSAVCLRVGGDGFTTCTAGPLASGESFDAVVARAPVVTVRVVDAAGQPLPRVALQCRGGWFASRQPSGCSDDSGRWRFTWYGEGPIEVQAQDPDYGELGRITLAQPVAEVDLPTQPPAPVEAVVPDITPGTVAIHGRVVDPDGDKPVVAAWVRAVAPEEAKKVDLFVLVGFARGRPDATRTGIDGSFVLHLMPGDYFLVAAGANTGSAWRMPGRERNPTPMPIQVRVDKDMAPVALRLQPLVGLRGSVGKVKLPRGCMVQFVPDRASWWGSEEWDFTQRFPLTTDGAFIADGLLARRYRLQLLVPRGFRQGLPDRVPLAVVDVESGADLKVDAAKALPATVHGKVHSNVPATRLAVLSLPANDKNSVMFGGVHYGGPVCPLARDGSYRLSEPPGARALLVVDLWSGVVLARESLTTVQPGSDRQRDLEVTALPLDVEVRGVPAGAEPWLDIVVTVANWPAGLGQMDGVGINRQECGLGVALPRESKPIRLWLRAGETRLVLRESHAVYANGKGVLADVTVDPTTAAQGRVVLEAAGGDRGNK